MTLENRITLLRKSFIILLALMLLVPLTMAPNNFGGSGLDLSYNLPIWIAASWIIVAALFLAMLQGKIYFPIGYQYLIAFPALAILSSNVAGNLASIEWFFRQAYIFTGLLFLFALFQYTFKTNDVERALYVIVIASLLFALIGTLQIVYPELIASWFYIHESNIPFGIFRQINVQATFLVTGLISGLYLITRPSFTSAPLLLKSTLLISILLSNYNILASGSRIGLLSLVVSALVLMVSRRKHFARQKKMLVAVFFGVMIGAYCAQIGLSKTIDKTSRMTESAYSDARLSMYKIGFELVMQKPLQGHGIGSFQQIWSEQASYFKSRYPDATLPEYPSHPHNELLFWMIEGGIISFIGILLFIYGMIVALYKCGLGRGGAYLALLLPISLHTQVELPFYISSLHWFVWIFLLYLPLSHSQRSIKLLLSHAATKFVSAMAVIVAVLLALFIINTQRAQEDIYNFMFNPNVQPPYLNTAFGNLYLRPMATQIAMRTMLYEAIENNDKKKLYLFAEWAEQYVVKKPEPKVYGELISALFHLDENAKACSTALKANKLHPNHEKLIVSLQECREP